MVRGILVLFYLICQNQPAAIISFKDIAGRRSPDTAKVWGVGSKLFAQKTQKMLHRAQYEEVVYWHIIQSQMHTIAHSS